MRSFRLQSKDVDIFLVAKSRKSAFGKFFKHILDKKIPLEKIGNLVMLYDKREEYPFRTAPALFLLGLIDEETAIANIQKCLECSETEAGLMLYKASKKDLWIVKEVTGKSFKPPPFV